MPNKRSYDDFDLNDLEAFLNEEPAAAPAEPEAAEEPAPIDFDIFNFSMDELRETPEPKKADELDLDSFLAFFEKDAAETAQVPAESPPDVREEEAADEPASLPEEAPFEIEPFEEEPLQEEPSEPEPPKKRKRRGKKAEEPEPESEAQEPEDKPRKISKEEAFAALFGEPQPKPEEAPVPEPEPELEPEPEPAPKPKRRKRTKPVETPPEAEAPPAEPEAPPAGAEAPAAEEPAERPKRKKRAKPPAEPVEPPAEDETPPPAQPPVFEADAAEAPVEEPLPKLPFWARFRSKYIDPIQDDEPLPSEEPEAESAARRPLFGRRGAEKDEAPAEESSEAEQAGAYAEPKIRTFKKLTPEKAAFQEAMRAKEKEHAAHTPPSGSLASVSAAGMTPADIRRQLPRDLKNGEMLVYDSELDEVDYDDSEDLPETRDYMPIRFRRYGRSGLGGGLMYAIFVLSISIILACAGWLFASDVLALNKEEYSAVITVQPYVAGPDDTLNEDGEPVDEDGRVITSDIDQVSTSLKNNGVIEFRWLFKLFSQVSHAYAKIDPGTYDVSATLDYRALVTEMQTGSDSQEITTITFPEGYSMEQIFQLLEDNGVCNKDDLYEAAANHEFSYDWLTDIPLGDATRLEGYLFPDTYDFYQGESAVTSINRFLNRFHNILTADMYVQAENLGISIHDAVIVASLIEKEAGAEDDRSLFASVIYNRLNDGWKLQLDSTINYINNTSTFNITYADLETDSPYNTYMYGGLPAGPICSPGKASLEAALNPSSTNYWYWYAFEGKTYFFTNSGDFDNFAAEHPY